jgi:hypothetical protein
MFIAPWAVSKTRQLLMSYDCVPIGQHHVYVGLPPPPRGDPTDEPDQTLPRPDTTFPPTKHRNLETSGLTAEVHVGDNTLDGNRDDTK